MISRINLLVDFTSQLRDLLSPLYISPNTGIFEQTLCELIGIPFSKDHLPLPRIACDHGGDFVFYTPQHFSLADINRCLQYIGMDPDAWTTSSGFHISQEIMMNKIFPAVQDAIVKMEKSHPGKFRDYQIESRPELESAAIAKIEESLAPIAVSLLGQYDNLGEVKNRLDYTVALMRQTFRYMLSSRRSDKQDMLIVCIEKFRNLHAVLKAIYENNPELRNKERLWQHLSAAIDALDAFNKFNRTDAIIYTRLLFKEMDDFLFHYEVTSTACDIFEHTLLKLAGITTVPESCKFEICHRDDSRVKFTIKGISDVEAVNLCAWLRTHGDETMREEGDMECRPVHVFTADGENFYKNILPIFYKEVEAMQASSELIKPYQLLSQMKFDSRLCAEANSEIDDLLDIISGKTIVDIKGVDVADDIRTKLSTLSDSLCGSIIRQQHGAEIARAADDLVKFIVNTIKKDVNSDYADIMDSLLEKLYMLSIRFASCVAPLRTQSHQIPVQTSTGSSVGGLFSAKDRMQEFVSKEYNKANVDLTRLTK